MLKQGPDFHFEKASSRTRVDCIRMQGASCIYPVTHDLSFAYPTDDQEVAGSTPAGSGNILSWRLIMKYFCMVILSSTYSRRDLED